MGNIGQQLKGGVKNSLGKSVEGLKGKPESSNGKAGTDTAYPLFREWLITEGAVRIPDQAGPWFDAQGWFDVDLFHHYLKDHGYKVDQLETTASRQEWGERLRQLLFKDKVPRKPSTRSSCGSWKMQQALIQGRHSHSLQTPAPP